MQSNELRNSPFWEIALFFTLLFLFVTLACTFSMKDEGASETQIAIALKQTHLAEQETALAIQETDMQKTQDALDAATETPTPTPTMDLTATQIAQSTLDAVASKTQAVESAKLKLTDVFSRKLTSTAEALLQGTQQAQPLFEWLLKLEKEGKIPNTRGDFYPIDDFDESMAKIDYFGWWRTDYSALDFAILADVAWDVDGNSANWFNTGCGFVFSEDEEKNSFHFMQLSLDGYITLYGINNGNWTFIQQKKFGKPTIPSGQANVLMVVNSGHILIYVDNNLVVDARSTRLIEGTVSLSLSSGTNRGFGTRCQMTNIGLWIFDK